MHVSCLLSCIVHRVRLIRQHEKFLKTFHHRCIRIILGISNQQQCSERITMRKVRRRWGDEELVVEKVSKQKLEWLDHVARVPDHRLPKYLLFVWLTESHPRCG